MTQRLLPSWRAALAIVIAVPGGLLLLLAGAVLWPWLSRFLAAPEPAKADSIQPPAPQHRAGPVPLEPVARPGDVLTVAPAYTDQRPDRHVVESNRGGTA